MFLHKGLLWRSHERQNPTEFTPLSPDAFYNMAYMQKHDLLGSFSFKNFENKDIQSKKKKINLVLEG